MSVKLASRRQSAGLLDLLGAERPPPTTGSDYFFRLSDDSWLAERQLLLGAIQSTAKRFAFYIAAQSSPGKLLLTEER